MWFKDKKQVETAEEPLPRKIRGRHADIRTELGINAASAHAEYTRRPTTRSASSATSADTSTVYNEEVQLNDLKIRARRRLTGALVLLAVAFFVLPWVFDDNRKLVAPTVAVSVPDKNIQFDVKNPRADGVSPTVNSDNLKPADVTNPDKAVTPTKSEVKPEIKPEAKSEAKSVETVTDIPVGVKSKYVVHIGIVSSQADLNALLKRLSAAGVQARTEKVTVNGKSKTRVRIGPFDNQADAQRMADKAKGAAKNPVVIPVNR